MKFFFTGLILSLFTCFTVNLFSQQYNFRYYSLENGLAQSQVLSICQDSRGNIWLGTYGGGLNRFDGISFALYTISNGLQSNTITAIFEDSKKNIWVGTSNGGVCRYNGKDFYKLSSAKITVLSINEDKKGNILIGTEKNGVFKVSGTGLQSMHQLDFLKGNAINSIFRDKNKNIWFATEKTGVIFWPGNDIKTFTLEQGLPCNNVKCITQDKTGIFWIGTTEGLCTLESNNIRIIPLNGNAVNITSLVIDNNDALWVGTFGSGLYKYSQEKSITLGEKEGIKSQYINCITLDNTGSICIGTDGYGMCRFEGERFRYITKQNGLPNNAIMSLCQDSKGVYWFGSYGNGVCRYSEGNFEYYTKQNGLCDNIIYSIVEDDFGKIWFGSKTNGISCFDGVKFKNYSIKNGLCSDLITTLIKDKKNNIWIATKTGGVSKFNGKEFINYTMEDGLSSNNIVTLYADISGNIWVGTQEGDVNIIFVGDNPYIKKIDNLKSCIYAIVGDKSGIMWFGTQDNGIYVYDGKIFHNYTTKDGLTTDFVYSMIFDNENNMWIGTSKGVDKIKFIGSYNQFTVKNYSIKEGFTGIETNMHAILKDNKNELWFGTVNGIMIYNPKADSPNFFKPKITITDILLFFQKADLKKYSSEEDSLTRLPENLRLPYNKNYITFKFIGIDISNPESVQYKWKLEGFDEEWTPLMSQREAAYSNLPPGDYLFLVKSYNSNGIGDEIPAEFQFTIVPPFWRTWIFRVVIIVLLTTIIFFYVKRRLNKLERDKEKLERIVRDRTEEIFKQKTEILDKNKKLETVNIELEKLSIVARETDNAVLIMDRDGNFEWLNEGFVRLYEYVQKDIDSMKGINLLQISTYPEIKKVLSLCYETKQSISYEAPATTRSGKNIWTHTTITPIVNEKDEIVKLVAIDSDISMLIQAEQHLKEEKEKSENLLRNILPAETAEELKEKGSATPRYYKSATVAFTDFKGFTLLCESITPRELVDELHTSFVAFDEIIETYSLEKIKTIGDSYMFAGGLPAETKYHPVKVILAALKIQDFMKSQNVTKRNENKQEWHLRIGIHTGEVITGVVGNKKFAYDIWGDTVNVASRMESAGIPEAVNVSAQTHELIKDFFICTYRGDIDVKHKDKIGMYIVNALKPEYAESGNKIEANQKFLDLISG